MNARSPFSILLVLGLGTIASIPTPVSAATAAPAASPASGPASSKNPMRAIAIAEDERRGDAELLGDLRHADAAVRARAARAVGRLQDSTHVTALAPLLKDSDLEVRREAAFALGQIGHRSARGALTEALGGSDPELTRRVIEALGKLGDRAATATVARTLGDASPTLRGEACVALWRLADSTAIDRLIERIRDADAGVRWRALYALEKTVAPDRIVLRAALSLDDPDPLVRAFACRTIGFQKSARGLAYLLPRLTDPDESVIVNALRGVQRIGDSTCGSCTPAVLGALLHPHPYVRVTAATVLGERFAWARLDSAGGRRATDALVARLKDDDAATRGAAARALLLRRGDRAVASVMPLLADSSAYVRGAVLGALTELSPDGARAFDLPGKLAPPTPLFDRMAAAEALGARHDSSAAERLRAGLADTSALYVASCAGALAEMGDRKGVPALARTYAAHVADPDADARLSIRDALRTLAGVPFADSVERAHPPRASASATYDSTFQNPPNEKGARLVTTRGEIEWAFYGREAPQTVKNFVRLARRGYFDGLAVHRVVPNFVIQDGDPTGTGSGGPGYTIRCEYNALQYEPGMVGMALSGKDTGGSQWFITHSPQMHLNGRYTIFAHVTRGLDVVHRVVQGDRILRVVILE